MSLTLTIVALVGGFVFLRARTLAGTTLRRPAPLFVALFAAVIAAGCAGPPSQGTVERGGEEETAPIPEVGRTALVTRAVDGDTVEISPAIDGIEDVRLIGMDTPELSGDCGTEPLAREAADYTARYAGERVRLEFDEERTDRYGRLLAYVYAPDGAMLNEELVRRGLAQVATFPPNVRYEEDFMRVQDRAREAGIGIWGLSSERQDLLADRGNGIGGGC